MDLKMTDVRIKLKARSLTGSLNIINLIYGTTCLQEKHGKICKTTLKI